MSHMELARPVAALTTNLVALENRRPIPVERTANHRLDPVGVAKQACGLDRPVKMVIQLFIAGRQAPSTCQRVPGDRRLDEEAVAIDEISQASPS